MSNPCSHRRWCSIRVCPEVSATTIMTKLIHTSSADTKLSGYLRGSLTLFTKLAALLQPPPSKPMLWVQRQQSAQQWQGFHVPSYRVWTFQDCNKAPGNVSSRFEGPAHDLSQVRLTSPEAIYFCHVNFIVSRFWWRWNLCPWAWCQAKPA